MATSRSKTADELEWLFEDERGSTLERTFITLWKQLKPDLPEPVREYLFARPYKNWRIDFAWKDQFIGLELQGGSWKGGRHNRGAGMTEDYKKFNWGLLHGWRIVLVTSDMLTDDPDAIFQLLKELIEGWKAA